MAADIRDIVPGQFIKIRVPNFLARKNGLKANETAGIVEAVTTQNFRLRGVSGVFGYSVTTLIEAGPAPAGAKRPAERKAPAKPSVTPLEPNVHGKVYVRSGYIYAAMPETQENYNRCRAILGARWDDGFKCWKYEATGARAFAILQEFAGSHVDLSDPEFQEMARSYANTQHAQAAKIADPRTLAQPPHLKHALWDHQLRAYHFVMNMGSCGLYMAMGCGKSAVTVAVVLNRGVKRTLVLCPKSVCATWPEEFAKHSDDPVIVCALDSSKDTVAKKTQRAKDAIADAERLGVPVVIAINYESAYRPPFGPSYRRAGKRNVLDHPGFVIEASFEMIVIDEGHKIKNPTGVTSEFCAAIGPSAQYRLELTGTPIAHDPLDIWAQFRFIDPHILPEKFNDFKYRYARFEDFNNRDKPTSFQHVDELAEIIERHSFRVTKDVLDLPEQVFLHRYYELSDVERRHYREMEDNFETWLQEAGKEVSAGNVMTRLIRLAQINSGYISDEAGVEHHIGDSRLDLLDEIIDDIDENEPLAIFARFTHDIQNIKARMLKRGYRTGELSGHANDLAAFKRGDLDVLVVQIQSGGAGIDLTHAGARQCRYCIYFGKDFNWVNYEQSLSRIHRPGQRETTYFIALVGKGTVDQKIERTLKARGNLAESVLKSRSFKHVEIEGEVEAA